MDRFKLLKTKFRNRPFAYKDVKRLGITQPQLNVLLKSEKIQRIGRGVYLVSGADLAEEGQFEAATLRIAGPSAICLLSALAHYDLTDQIPKKVWLLVPINKPIAHKDIRALRTRNPHWKIGIEKKTGYSITSVERTIVDALALKAVARTVGIAALKRALAKRATTLDAVLKMANRLKLDHRVLTYIEALA
jgi:predicted transcriptional regulator of viral defense system